MEKKKKNKNHACSLDRDLITCTAYTSHVGSFCWNSREDQVPPESNAYLSQTTSQTVSLDLF